MSRIRLVDCFISGNANEYVIIGCEFRRDSARQYIFVIMLGPCGEILAETIALVPCDRSADRQAVTNRNGDLPDQIDLIECTVGCANLAAKIIA